MKNGPRWLFVAAAVLALAAVVQNFRFDASMRAASSEARRVEHDTSVLRLRLADLRGAQMAYLAAGQDPDFWLRHASELTSEIESDLAQLQPRLQNESARAGATKAAEALAELIAADKRARVALSSNQRFLAADVVFTESLAPTQALIDALEGAKGAETAAMDAAMTRDSRLQLVMMAAALIVALAAGFVWAQSKPQPLTSPAAGVAQMLRDLPPPVRSPLPLPATAVAAKAAPPPPPPIDLFEAAELCVDLARVMDSSDVPTLLGRAAKALEAAGAVIWVVTADGSSLVPVLTHGYASKVVSRLGPLAVDADNMTSACYRSMRPQSMAGVGYPGATSAVAVPLITADGGHGVLAIELKVAKPPAETLALARIIAAQFATMISPVESAAQTAAPADDLPSAAEA